MYDKNSQGIFQESANNINQNQSEENSGGNSSQNGTEDQPQTAEHGVVNSGPIRIITIIGQIEGHTQLPKDAKTTKYEHLIPMLAEMQRDNNVKCILFIVNTLGGDVEAGLALAEIIRSMDKPTVSLVIGGGHSIGVPISVSTNYSFIAKTATMTVHPIRTTGLMINVPQTFRYYEKMQNRVEDFVCENSKISHETLNKLMNAKDEMADDIGTVLVGGQAVDAGIIDEVGGLSSAFNKLYDLIDNVNNAQA